MSADRPELSAGVAALTGEVVTLNEQLLETNESVKELAKSTKKLGETSRTHSKWIYGTVATVIVDVAVTAVVWLLFDQQSTIITQQAAIIQQLESTQRELKISVGESCAFYGLIIGSYRPESRPPGQDRETYEHNFDRMRLSFQRLKCDPGSIVPPAIQAPTTTPTR